MSSGKVVLGLLAGLAGGALLGILFAPEKGSKTRKQIVRKGEDVVDEVKEKFNEILDDISKKMDGVKAKAKEMVEEPKVKKEEAKAASN